MSSSSSSIERPPLAGVLGWPITHSLSPAIHQFWLKTYRLEGRYVKTAVEPHNLETTLRQLSSQGFRGVNLTVPHKEVALRYVDKVDLAAQRVGAINTVLVQKDGSLYGLNTDVYGFKQNLLLRGFRMGQGPATILGAGGAARAAITALVDHGTPSIRVVNRTRARAEALTRKFGSKVKAYNWGDEEAFHDSRLLVNATTLGLKSEGATVSDFPALPLRRLLPDAWVMDMVYTPPMTDFLKTAQEAGYVVVDGLGMLLHQARPAFAAFFGHEPEVTEELRRTIEAMI